MPSVLADKRLESRADLGATASGLLVPGKVIEGTAWAGATGSTEPTKHAVLGGQAQAGVRVGTVLAPHVVLPGSSAYTGVVSDGVAAQTLIESVIASGGAWALVGFQRDSTVESRVDLGTHATGGLATDKVLSASTARTGATVLGDIARASLFQGQSWTGGTIVVDFSNTDRQVPSRTDVGVLAFGTLVKNLEQVGLAVCGVYVAATLKKGLRPRRCEVEPPSPRLCDVEAPTDRSCDIVAPSSRRCET